MTLQEQEEIFAGLASVLRMDVADVKEKYKLSQKKHQDLTILEFRDILRIDLEQKKAEQTRNEILGLVILVAKETGAYKRDVMSVYQDMVSDGRTPSYDTLLVAVKKKMTSSQFI